MEVKIQGDNYKTSTRTAKIKQVRTSKVEKLGRNVNWYNYLGNSLAGLWFVLFCFLIILNNTYQVT